MNLLVRHPDQKSVKKRARNISEQWTKLKEFLAFRGLHQALLRQRYHGSVTDHQVIQGTYIHLLQ